MSTPNPNSPRTSETAAATLARIPIPAALLEVAQVLHDAGHEAVVSIQTLSTDLRKN